MKLINFWIYRWFGGNVINRFRKLFGLKIKRLYYLYEEPKQVIIMLSENHIENMLIKELKNIKKMVRVSTHWMTAGITVSDGVLVEPCAPILKRWLGQSFDQLKNWVIKNGGSVEIL